MHTPQPTKARSAATRAWATTALLTGLIAASVVTAESLQPAPANAAETQATTASADSLASSLGVTATSPLFAVNGNRAAIIDTIVNQWKVELEAGQAGGSAQSALQELRSSLQTLRADQLLVASLARTFDGMKQVFASADAAAAAVATEKSTQKALGDAAADLVYTPVTPCKLVDTRPSGVSPYGAPAYKLTAGMTSSVNYLYSVNVAGTPCVGLPTTGIAVLHVSVTTSYGGAGGHILSLFNNPPPTNLPVSNVFSAGYSQVTTLVGATTTGQFNARVSTAGVDLLVDIIGYFAPPKATALDCIVSPSEYFTLPAAFAGPVYTTVPAACAGRAVVSSICWNTNLVPGVTVMGSGMSSTGPYCGWNNQTGVTQNVAAALNCCRVPGL